MQPTIFLGHFGDHLPWACILVSLSPTLRRRLSLWEKLDKCSFLHIFPSPLVWSPDKQGFQALSWLANFLIHLAQGMDEVDLVFLFFLDLGVEHLTNHSKGKWRKKPTHQHREGWGEIWVETSIRGRTSGDWCRYWLKSWKLVREKSDRWRVGWSEGRRLCCLHW